MTHFWAKTTAENKPGISVYDHMLNVGCVARFIAEMYPELLERFQLSSSMVGGLAALHDLGKISPGFQRKCTAWLHENDLIKIDRNDCWDTAMEPNHGKVSHAAIQVFLSEAGIDRKTGKFVSTVIGGHHGRLSRPNDRGYRPDKLISDSASQINWDTERLANARMVWGLLSADIVPLVLSEDSSSLWWLAGLTSIADWIGSDERFFSPERREREVDVSSLAQNALKAIGFCKTEFAPNLSFHDLFHDPEKPEIRWLPNEMQEKALATVRGPGVYIIEAPMGMGKTEAALWAAYHLLVSGNAAGIYFALPTQATSNRMHLRMNEFVHRISQTGDTSRLIHGASWLMDQKAPLSPVSTSHDSANDDARIGRDWFSSPKRALIAPFGVGTIDQALLGVVAAKHFFVRHFALAGKVVILDEIHSYDLYTGTLIDKLIKTLEALGCTVIVLSATLTGKRREQIVSCQENIEEESKRPYPLITGRYEGDALEPVEAKPPKPQTVEVKFLSKKNTTQEAIKLARKGGAVLWVCNTVDSAQKQYGELKKLGQKEFPIGLLHSRFPFWRREKLEEEWMERFGKNGKTRCGSILVSTQIVEQSVDLDADLLITELAPTDMLLQRLGRLWRHERGKRQVDVPQLFIIEEEKSLDEFRAMKEEAIIKTLGSKAKIYAPYILLRSLEVWSKEKPQISIPCQVRQLIESTYEEKENEPNSWQELSAEWFGTDSAKKMLAFQSSNLWQVALDDQEGVQTRINEILTVSMVLCKKINKKEAAFVDGTSGEINKDSFCLPTAQAIHKNLVKVPKYCFDVVKACSAFKDYLYVEQTVGIVAENGALEVKGLKNGTRLFYSDELGLLIDNS